MGCLRKTDHKLYNLTSERCFFFFNCSTDIFVLHVFRHSVLLFALGFPLNYFLFTPPPFLYALKRGEMSLFRLL